MAQRSVTRRLHIARNTRSDPWRLVDSQPRHGAQSKPTFMGVIMLKILIAAGIGGTLPTVSRLAAAYAAGGNPPFSVQVCVALGLFFVIGVAVALGLGESEARKAFVLGIAAPAIVTSTVNSATQAKPPTAPGATPPAAQRQDSSVGSLAALFGIDEAKAQATNSPQVSTFPRQAPAVLHVTSSVSTSRTYPIDQLELRFLSNSGAVLASTVIDPRVSSPVSVPLGAQAVEATIAGQATRIPLPSNSYASADLKLTLGTSHVSDFLWALGSNLRVRVEGVTGSLGGIVPPMVQGSEPSVGPGEAVALAPGTRVFSQSGAPVGVVESVKPAAGEKSAQVLVRPEDSLVPAK